jgi:hypothetical protein
LANPEPEPEHAGRSGGVSLYTAYTAWTGTLLSIGYETEDFSFNIPPCTSPLKPYFVGVFEAGLKWEKFKPFKPRGLSFVSYCFRGIN